MAEELSPRCVWYRGDWSDPEALMARARYPFRCGAVLSLSAECDQIAFRDRPGAPLTLVGRRPPRDPDEFADQDWAEAQADRVLDQADPRAWIFVPRVKQEFATRRLVERILSRLKSAGARVEQPVTLGQSALYRVTLP